MFLKVQELRLRFIIFDPRCSTSDKSSGGGGVLLQEELKLHSFVGSLLENKKNDMSFLQVRDLPRKRWHR